MAAVMKAPGRNGVVVSNSKERWGRLSEHPLPGEDRLQRHCIICRENRVQVTLVQDGHHRAVAVLEGSRVQVRLERVNSHVEIVVSDTGMGISPDFLPYVFERFRQAESVFLVGRSVSSARCRGRIRWTDPGRSDRDEVDDDRTN